MEEMGSKREEHGEVVLTGVGGGLTYLLHLVAGSNMLLLVRLSSTQLTWLYAEREEQGKAIVGERSRDYREPEKSRI
jgi:hypothetical protein